MRWALVTSGAQGLGAAISRHLLSRGYGVIVHFYRSENEAQAIASEGGDERVRLFSGSLAGSQHREKLAEFVQAECGRLDLLVNNLGVYLMKDLLETSVEEWDEVLSLGCTANFHLTKLCLPMLRSAAPGSGVINVGDSGCDRITSKAMATPYHVAKLGVHVLTRTYAELLMSDGVTVNMVSPGFLENSIGQPDTPLPAGQPNTFEDVLAAVDYLTSKGARRVSGTNLLVSGAWNLR